MSDPVIDAMIREFINKIKSIGATLPLEYTIDGLTIKIEEQDNDTSEDGTVEQD